MILREATPWDARCFQCSVYGGTSASECSAARDHDPGVVLSIFRALVLIAMKVRGRLAPKRQRTPGPCQGGGGIGPGVLPNGMRRVRDARR
jgi:hypothetical protein